MDKLLEILSRIRPEIDFTADTALIGGGILDSFDIITLIAEISDVFGVNIPPVEITPERFDSVPALYGLIRGLSE